VHRNLEISAFANPTKAKENTVPINTVKDNKSLSNPYRINPLQLISQGEIGNGKHGFYYHHPLGFYSHMSASLPYSRIRKGYFECLKSLDSFNGMFVSEINSSTKQLYDTIGTVVFAITSSYSFVYYNK
jgi:hypothetical protein